jgi:hypothetical protein
MASLGAYRLEDNKPPSHQDMKYLKLPLGLLAGLLALTALGALLAKMLPLLERSLGANPHVSYVMLLVSGVMLLGSGVSILRAWQFNHTQLLELGLPLIVLVLGYRNLGKFQDPAAAMDWAAKVLSIVPRDALELMLPFALPLASLGALVGACALSAAVTMLVMRMKIFRS